MKKTFGKILLDLIPVAIGVYVGLLVSNWNDNKKTDEITQNTIKRVQREINLNQQSILDAVRYHNMIRDTIKTIDQNNLPADARVFKFWRGINMPRLHKSAFETVKQTGIANTINPDILEQLNKLYTLQDSYNDFSKTASQSLYNIDFTKEDASRRMLTFISMSMSDIYYFEQGLNLQFERTLKTIDSLN